MDEVATMPRPSVETRGQRLDRRVTAALGLFIVKALVEAHGGHMAVESKPGHGSAFRFSVPVAAPVDGHRS